MQASRSAEYDTIIVGGGFFGCCLADYFRRERGERVVILEMSPELVRRASYANQARVHNGYHYPRSLLTALRCRVNFPRFLQDYSECIVDDFDKYYAIGRAFSKVTANQFRIFCERVGAPLAPAPDHVRDMFNPDLIEDVFQVREVAFDALKLQAIMHERLLEAGVEIRLRTEAQRVRLTDLGHLEVAYEAPHEIGEMTAQRVFNCTYSRINQLPARSGLPLLHLKHEFTEMPLVHVPDAIKHQGITVMCGPFFSLMPFPPLGLHTLSHVRYTPHCEWWDRPGSAYMDPYQFFDAKPKKTNYPYMIRDVQRYMPCLGDCRYSGDSIWEVKTVLPKSETDDSRPVLFQQNHGLPNLTSLMGGKIDNVYDIIEFEALQLV